VLHIEPGHRRAVRPDDPEPERLGGRGGQAVLAQLEAIPAVGHGKAGQVVLAGRLGGGRLVTGLVIGAARRVFGAERADRGSDRPGTTRDDDQREPVGGQLGSGLHLSLLRISRRAGNRPR
jgi:hypothetical protein